MYDLKVIKSSDTGFCENGIAKFVRKTGNDELVYKCTCKNKYSFEIFLHSFTLEDFVKQGKVQILNKKPYLKIRKLP